MENQDLEVFNKTVIFDENSHFFVQPLCDFFGISNQNQSRIIKNDAVLQNQWTKKSNDFLFGDNHQRTCLTKKGFVRWIQLISPNIVKPELREKLAAYQSLVFDYIYGEPLIQNVTRQYEIDMRLKELNSSINKLMLEHKALQIERKSLTLRNYLQLGLNFPDETNDFDELQPFHQKKQIS